MNCHYRADGTANYLEKVAVSSLFNFSSSKAVCSVLVRH